MTIRLGILPKVKFIKQQEFTIEYALLKFEFAQVFMTHCVGERIKEKYNSAVQ